MTSHPAALARLNAATRDRFRRHCRPLPRLTMSEHAARYRVLSPEATANHGRWRNDIVPYMVPIMDAISDRTTQEITCVAPSQSAKSEGCVLNPILYFIHQEPSPILVVQPTVETAESFSKDRVAPMIRDSDVLRALVGPPRSRDTNNTLLSKQFPGGQLDITGANAPSGLAMRPKRIVLLDERDRHPRSAGTEGDVKAIARARTRSFGRRRKIVEVSSPTSAEESLIWPSYLEGTQEVVHLVCPACDTAQPPVFEQLKYAQDDSGKVIPASVAYVCGACQHRMPASEQRAIKRAARVIQTAEPRVPFKRSFRIHGLVAGFHDWVEIAQEFVTANSQKDPALRGEMLRAFFNTTLGELYRDQVMETRTTALLARATRYDGGSGDEPVRFQVPRFVGVLVAGCDVQHDRVELIVRGFGVGKESALIERAILRGDTSQPAFWQGVDTFRQKTWLHESGARLGLRALAIDAGDGSHAKRIYEYAAPRLYQGVYAVKGSSNPLAPIVPAKATRVKPGRLWVIGVHAIMDVLYRRLSMDSPGPGFLHLNEYATEDYVTQLLSMRRVYDERTRKRKWEATPGVRNEVPDAETYAYAALEIAVPESTLADEVTAINAAGAQHSGAAAVPDEPAPEPAPARPASSWLGRRGGSWMGRVR